MAYVFGSIWDRFNRNALNALSKSVEQQGKSIQDLVAKGQLTPTQYATLIQAVNGLVSKGDVSVLDINKNLGKFDATYFTNEFLDDLNNGTVNATKLLPSSVLRQHINNGAVTGAKTTFIKPASSNLFNKNNSIYGYYLNESGLPVQSETFSYTEPVNIDGGSKYVLGGLEGNVRINYFNSDHSVVNSYTEVATWGTPLIVTAPSNAIYMVINVRLTRVDSFYINKGDKDLGYEDYYDELTGVKVDSESIGKNSLSGEALKDGSINDNKVSFIETSSNKFDRGTIKTNTLIDDSGNEVPNNSYATFGFVSVKPNQTYTSAYIRAFALYDVNGKFIRRQDVRPIESEPNYTFQIPSDVYQVRPIVQTGLNNPSTAQLNEGDALLPYEPYYKKLSDNIKVEGATGLGEKTVYISVPNEGISYFGIDGNGVSDDTQGLKDYLYSLKENGGGEMSLPNGTYIINGTLEVPSNVIISGQGNSTLFKLGDNHDLTGRVFRGERISRPYIVTEEDSENVYFRDFKVLGNTNISEDALHHAVAFMDTLGGGISNVSTGYINYDPTTANTADLMAFNVAFIRAKEIVMRGGKHEYGGYENVGFEHSQDIIVDGIFSGDAWRTSYQVHQGNKNIKTINSTVRQTLSTADAALTIHARGSGPETDILFANNTILLEAPGGSHPYMGTIQMFGPNKKVSFLGNTIKGQKNGIYNLNTAELMIANDNIIEAETGIALRFDGPGIANGNFVKTKTGMTPFEKAEGSNVVGSGNIGFNIV